jgi:hypothetical protein
MDSSLSAALSARATRTRSDSCIATHVVSTPVVHRLYTGSVKHVG